MQYMHIHFPPHDSDSEKGGSDGAEPRLVDSATTSLPGMLMASEVSVDQPASVVSTWIDHLLRQDIVPSAQRMMQARDRFHAQALDWDSSVLTRALQAAKDSAHAMDFQSLSNPGLLGLLLGRSAQNRSNFVAQYRKLTASMDSLRDQHLQLGRSHRNHSVEARRALIDLEAECRTCGAHLDHGVAWLEQLSADLTHRKPAEAGIEYEALQKVASRAEHQTAQLKQVEAAIATARDVLQAGQNILTRRVALLETLRVDLDGYEKIWLRRVGTMAQEASQSGRSLTGMDGAEIAHRELTGRIERSSAACVALQVEEQLLAHRLSLLREQLQPFVGDLAAAA